MLSNYTVIICKIVHDNNQQQKRETFFLLHNHVIRHDVSLTKGMDLTDKGGGVRVWGRDLCSRGYKMKTYCTCVDSLCMEETR